ncbi:uncharacterized protein LOC125775166 isoform X1 [Anopheles funestus]|uniref:uncharacterized protein LOC125775166 isoform X1 n=1 Tax=Anopheles funestus TaxID=62324 RepID=UPI0020C6606E|nr:uncharacterized protein LOC125775166 isoform X1 [Anopheles funestus]
MQSESVAEETPLEPTIDQPYQPSAVDHRNNRCRKRLLHLGDSLFSLFVITPLVVAHWRGTWCWMDLNGPHFPGWLCFVLGFTLHTTFALLREPLNAALALARNAPKSRWKTFKRWLGNRMYTYAFSMACLMHWRGGWNVMELYFAFNLLPALSISAFCLLGLVWAKSVRNLLAPPFIILTDRKEAMFSFPTRFRMKGSKDPGLYVLDCMFSVLVIGSLVVFVWRGLWVLLDLKLFPEDHGTSAWASIIIGYGVTGVTFSLQPLMRFTCDRLTGFWRVVVADMFLFFSFIGTINVWRGIWQALDTFFLPNEPLLSNWITHGAALLLLILLNCSNSVLVRGVYIDAEEPAGQCVVFPVYYIRLFFQKERKKKQRRLFDALERADLNSTGGVLQDKKHHHPQHQLPQQQQQQQQQQQKEPQHHHHITADQNHQVIRNLEAVPLTIIDDPKSNGDHSSQAPRM